MFRIIRKIILACFMLGISVQIFANDISLKQKIGQMVMIGFKGMELSPSDQIVKSILNQEIGGVVLFDYDLAKKTYDINIRNPSQLKHLTQQLQHYAKQAAAQHHNNLIPLLIGIDYEGGKVTRLRTAAGFPNTISAAEIGKGSDKQAKFYAEQMAETLQQEGINLNFAPVVDVNVNPNNPIISKLGRSFSSDPQQVIKDALIFSEAYKQHGVACSYKHFPGHGSSEGDTHKGLVDVTNTWQRIELEPYKELIPQPNACPAIMVAHVINRKLDPKANPASLSYPMITQLLRTQLGFNGVVITDDLQMDAIAKHYGLEEALKLSINAGADIVLIGGQLKPHTSAATEIVNIIYNHVKNGNISEKRIDEAYERIMRLKQQLQ